MPNDDEKPTISPLRHPYAALRRDRQENARASINTFSGWYANKSERGALIDAIGIMAIIVDNPDIHRPEHPVSWFVIDGHHLLQYVRHDPSPVLFDSRTKSTRPDSSETTSSEVSAMSGETQGTVSEMPPTMTGSSTESKAEVISDATAMCGGERKDGVEDSSTPVEGAKNAREPANQRTRGSADKGKISSVIFGLKMTM